MNTSIQQMLQISYSWNMYKSFENLFCLFLWRQWEMQSVNFLNFILDKSEIQ